MCFLCWRPGYPLKFFEENIFGIYLRKGAYVSLQLFLQKPQYIFLKKATTSIPASTLATNYKIYTKEEKSALTDCVVVSASSKTIYSFWGLIKKMGATGPDSYRGRNTMF